jgi:hypothetical protein
MRRFMVHLVTEIDFVDGDEASDVAAQNSRSISRRLFRTRPRGYRSTQSGTPTSKASRLQKLKLSSSNGAPDTRPAPRVHWSV